MTDSSARVAIIGGGAIGLSIAYHLAALGVRDLVLLERHQLTSGTSWHAAGIVGPLRASLNLTRLAQYGLELFDRLERDTGQATGYQQTGGVWLAQKPERMAELSRIKAMGDRCGLDTRLLTAGEIHARLPFIRGEDLCGGLWVDQDGQINPVDLCMAYARAARGLGVEIREACAVTAIEAPSQTVKAVKLADGSRIECEQLVLAAGAWSRQLAQMAGADLPLLCCEHMYLVTEPVAVLPKPCPIVRDLDAGIYLKGDNGKLVLGAFEANPKPWQPSPRDAAYLMFDEDWEHAGPMLEAGIHRAPLIAEQGITHFMNGPESFTPDTRQLMGELPQCKNLFVAAGFNSIGIMSSAGVGKVMAEWLVQGEAPMDLWEVDCTRLDPLQCDDEFMRQRLPEAVHNQFDMHWPFKQYRSGRGLRRSAWHQRLEKAGAVFGAPTSWERPLWYAKNDDEARMTYSYGAQSWWPMAQREAVHCGQRVSLFELSPFSKFEISGRDALEGLQRLCCNDLDIEPGRIAYSLMLNRRGGIEAELTVTRLDEHRFRIIGGAATRFRDWRRLCRELDPRLQLSVRDVTEDYAVAGIMGPASRDFLASLCEGDFSDSGFPFSTARHLEIAAVEVLAQRLSFVGETGWELYVPIAAAPRLLDYLLAQGAAHELGLAGHYALDACRLEVGYHHWGHDFGPDDTPFEAGLGFAVKLEKPVDFIGREALAEQKSSGWRKQLKLCEIDAEAILVLHDEPVYLDDVIVGHCTSGGLGFRTGKTLCFVMFYRSADESDDLQIELAGTRHRLKILSKPPYRKHR